MSFLSDGSNVGDDDVGVVVVWEAIAVCGCSETEIEEEVEISSELEVGEIAELWTEIEGKSGDVGVEVAGVAVNSDEIGDNCAVVVGFDVVDIGVEQAER